MITLEVCIDTPDGLAACVAGGANRIELCAALALGGLTPSAGMMALAAKVPIPVHAMIRPVAGGFMTTDAAFDTMLADVAAARLHGLAGVVVGVLTSDGALDVKGLRRLVDAAGSLEVTLHRVVDLCANPLEAIDQAADLGIARVLTSGGAKNAVESTAMIGAMVARANGRLTVMAGSGVTADNVADLVRKTGVCDVHASCATATPEAGNIAALGFGPVERRRTDARKIKAMRLALDGL